MQNITYEESVVDHIVDFLDNRFLSLFYEAATKTKGRGFSTKEYYFDPTISDGPRIMYEIHSSWQNKRDVININFMSGAWMEEEDIKEVKKALERVREKLKQKCGDKYKIYVRFVVGI